MLIFSWDANQCCNIKKLKIKIIVLDPIPLNVFTIIKFKEFLCQSIWPKMFIGIKKWVLLQK
jgi:hypothetical protein